MFSEEQIIRGCKKNERKAQRLLYDRYAPKMLGVCMRYAQNRHEAEDILQEGFIKIFLRIKQFENKGSFEGWIKKIIVNTAISNFRKNNRHYYHEEIDNISENNTRTYVPNYEFTKNELLQVIRELPEGYRIVFNLFAIEGYKHKEIAELLNINETTSKSQFSRAKKLIKKRLEKLSIAKTIA